MATGTDLRRMALALKGTTEGPHFDRAAFKVARIYVTLAADGRTANFKFTPDEQEFKCMMAPDTFAPIPNAWGRQGWTTATLSKLSAVELKRKRRGRTRRRSAGDDDHKGTAWSCAERALRNIWPDRVRHSGLMLAARIT
jgi:YjbR